MLLSGVAVSGLLGLLHQVRVPLSPVVPVLLTPHFSLSGLVGLVLPLTLLAFTGQLVPGLAAWQTNGYRPPVALTVRNTGVTSMVAALFGGPSVTLGALLANMVAGREAGESRRRDVAAVTAGALNVLMGSFVGTFLAGLALLAATAASLSAAFPAGNTSLAAPAAVLVTLSGVAPLGIGAAFRGVLAGLAVHAVDGRPRPAGPAVALTSDAAEQGPRQ